MRTTGPARSWAAPLRAAALSAVVLTAALVGAAVSADLMVTAAHDVSAPGPARFEDAITVGTAGAVILLLAWLALAVTVTALAVARPQRPTGALQAASRRVAPAALRRTVAALVGATVVGLSAPALAQADAGLDPGWATARTAVTVQVGDRAAGQQPEARAGQPTRLTVPGSTVEATWAAQARGPAPELDPGWVPQRPPPPPRAVTALPGATMRTGLLADDDVVVRRGDTLWGIAAGRLGPTAPDARVAAEWPRWYAANRAVIGADPDRLEPGQRLRPPADSAAQQTADHRTDQERTGRR